MSKCKLKVAKGKLANLKKASQIVDVELGENILVVDNDAIVEVNYKIGSQLFELGQKLDSVENVKISESENK